VEKYVFLFGGNEAQGNAQMASSLGGKGANLAEMARLGLPIPPGFTISSDMCLKYIKDPVAAQTQLFEQVKAGLLHMEAHLGNRFNDPVSPLLVSVRSGARVSMPGMMDTILNLGLTDQNVMGLAKKSKNPRFAFDSYRRFITMYSSVVSGISHHLLDEPLELAKQRLGVSSDPEVPAEELEAICTELKSIYLKEKGKTFPQDPWEQLWEAVGAVFMSWDGKRAQKYREINKIPNDWGTAVTVCAMVFGNLGDTSGTGVCFTRNPANGTNEFYGEFLMNAQGEDVVAGIRTPRPLSELAQILPQTYQELLQVRHQLERHYKNVQDIEFTIQEGKLFLLQTRNAKRTVHAALKFAKDMVDEKIITPQEALLKVTPEELEKILHPALDPNAPKEVLAVGLPASPGAVSGRVVFYAQDAESWSARGEQVLLVREETSPEDIGGMHASEGFLTARGGMTSHAAVVARQMGKPCVAGCSALHIRAEEKFIKVGKTEIFEGDWITLDGSTGEVLLGKVPTIKVQVSESFSSFMDWAETHKRLGVRANADNPMDARLAKQMGATGIGLCRTEHMFFDEHRLPAVRQMILAQNKKERETALAKLRPFQQTDFEGILEAMAGYPVTIRLLDPPLHEFLPHTTEDIESLAHQLKLSPPEVHRRVKALQEMNPMLGHRGCRLGITYPEIYQMQVQAIARATALCLQKNLKVYPEIMIPLVGLSEELENLNLLLKDTARKAFQETYPPGEAPHFEFSFGTMIEIPRAALTADTIAKHANFFSFGTNDLTQTTFGFSRDDSISFLKEYKMKGILKEDPFATIDIEGVGGLVRMACEKGRSTNPALKLGICGEHGGDPRSVTFFHQIGLDYVSCSPLRVPIAILSAAQASLKS
jgi:pyruvate,orthophosphate dikinase